jgi:hypothetical protein
LALFETDAPPPSTVRSDLSGSSTTPSGAVSIPAYLRRLMRHCPEPRLIQHGNFVSHHQPPGPHRQHQSHHKAPPQAPGHPGHGQRSREHRSAGPRSSPKSPDYPGTTASFSNSSPLPVGAGIVPRHVRRGTSPGCHCMGPRCSRISDQTEHNKNRRRGTLGRPGDRRTHSDEHVEHVDLEAHQRRDKLRQAFELACGIARLLAP